MFAVIKTGGKQYKVAANDVLKIEKLEAEIGDTVTFDQVLMVGEGADVTVGAPLVAGALVAAELVQTKKQRTVLIVKKHRRQHFDRRNGHRQILSTVRITEILTGGAKPTGEKPARAVRAPKAAAAPVGATAAVVKDDVKLIGGVGPALEKKLAAAGVTTLTQIAAWTPEDVERIGAELGFKGRIEREEWIDQAKDLLAGKPPRAKADQAAADAAEDDKN